MEGRGEEVSDLPSPDTGRSRSSKRSNTTHSTNVEDMNKEAVECCVQATRSFSEAIYLVANEPSRSLSQVNSQVRQQVPAIIHSKHTFRTYQREIEAVSIDMDFDIETVQGMHDRTTLHRIKTILESSTDLVTHYNIRLEETDLIETEHAELEQEEEDAEQEDSDSNDAGSDEGAMQSVDKLERHRAEPVETRQGTLQPSVEEEDGEDGEDGAAWLQDMVGVGRFSSWFSRWEALTGAHDEAQRPQRSYRSNAGSKDLLS